MHNLASGSAQDSPHQTNVEAIKRALEENFSFPSVTTPESESGVRIFFFLRDKVRYRVVIGLQFIADINASGIAALVKKLTATLSPEHTNVVVLRDGRIRHEG